MGFMGIGNSSSRVKVVEFKDAKGNVTGALSVSRPGTKKTKKLQYNHKQISTQLLRSKNSTNARNVMIRAKATTAQLKRMKKTGQYDDKELEIAIAHAEQLERIARKKLKHLKQEEGAEKGEKLSPCAPEEEQEEPQEAVMEEPAEVRTRQQAQRHLQESQKELEKLSKELEQLESLDEGPLELLMSSGNMTPEKLEQLKKKHRAQELKEITLADMRYLKAIFDRLEQDKRGSAGGSIGISSNSGVTLELGGMEIPYGVAQEAVPVEGTSMDTTV